jgi:hypothetical protein
MQLSAQLTDDPTIFLTCSQKEIEQINQTIKTHVTPNLVSSAHPLLRFLKPRGSATWDGCRVLTILPSTASPLPAPDLIHHTHHIWGPFPSLSSNFQTGTVEFLNHHEAGAAGQPREADRRIIRQRGYGMGGCHGREILPVDTGRVQTALHLLLWRARGNTDYADQVLHGRSARGSLAKSAIPPCGLSCGE